MNKSSKLTKVLSVAITVVMLLGVIACGMFASAAAPEWNASTQYNAGAVVSYNGQEWTAAYWTQGDVPGSGGEWGPWRPVGGGSTGGGNTGGGTTGGSGVKVPEDAMKNTSEKMDNYRAIYYVTQWNWPGTYDPVTQKATVNIPDDVLKNITHVNYAFGHIATLDAQGNAFPGYIDVPDPGKLHALVEMRDRMKAKGHDIKVLLSVGGWGMDGFCPIASDANKTKIFANSCKQIMEEFGLDGIDIDWEYPGTIGDHLDVLTCQHLKLPTWDDANRSANEYGVFVDGMNQVKLLKAVREVIGWDYLLTIASGVGYDWMCSVSIGELPDYLDFINIMCYDLYGDWEDHSEYNANLMPVPGRCSDAEGIPQFGPNTGNPLSYDVVCDRLALRGYPRDIMNIGIPFYGRDRAYSANGGLGGSVGVGDASWITYRQVAELKAKGAKVNWDDVTKASYLTGTVDGRTYDITYDDVKDVQAKMAWIQEKGFGGAMVWEISQDDSDHTLLKAIWDGLNGSGRKQDPPTPSYRFDGTKAGFTTGKDEPAQGDEPVKGVNTIWQSWRNLIPNHPDTVYYGGYSWKRLDISQKWPIPDGYTWMAAHHQGTFGWAPAYAPIFAQEPYQTPACIEDGNFNVKYPAEWEMAAEHPETRFPRNEAGKKTGAVNNSVLRISNIQPDKFNAPVGSTITWDVKETGGSGNYTVTHEIWFTGLKFDLDGSVKYEKRRTGGPYSNPTAAARLDANGNLVQKEVQEGDKMDKINPTVVPDPSDAKHQTVSATFNQEGKYHLYTVVKDSAGTIASVFSQTVVIGDLFEIIPNPVNLKVGETITLTTNKKPVNKWSIDDESIATIDTTTGKVTAIKEGTCTVTALYGDEGTGDRANAVINVTKDGTSSGGEDKFERTIVMKKNLTNSWVDGQIRENTKYENGAFATAISKPEGYLLPVRFVAEKFHMTVNYKGNGVTEIINDATKESLIVTKGSNIIKKYNADGTFKKDVQNEAITESIDTITYVPLRAVSEALGLGVAYRSTTDKGSYVVISTDQLINSKDKEVTDYINAAYGAGLR